MTGEVVHLHDRRPRPLHMMTEEQRDEALAAIRTARRARDATIESAYEGFNDMIRGCEAAGIPVIDIADAAGLTRARIYQILKEGN